MIFHLRFRVPSRFAFMLFVLFSAAGIVGAADPEAAADFTIGSQVLRANSERFGLNLHQGDFNTYIGDGAFEPVNIRRMFVASGGSPNTIEVDGVATLGRDLDFFNCLLDGFFDGATVRVYRSGVNGALVQVRASTVQSYRVGMVVVNNGFLLRSGSSPVSQAVDGGLTPGVTYYYGVFAIDSSGNFSNLSAEVSVTAQAGGGAAQIVNGSYTFAATDSIAPSAPMGLSAVANGNGTVSLDWADNPEADIVGYYLYRSAHPLADRNTILMPDSGGVAQAGDLVFLDLLNLADAPRDRMHPRLTGRMSNGVWRVYNGTNTPATDLTIQPIMTRDFSTVPPENGGHCSMRIQNTQAVEVSIRQARFTNPDPAASPHYGFYPALTPGVTYRAEAWLKQSGIASEAVNFRLTTPYAISQTWTVPGDNTWRHYTFTFTGPPVPTVANISDIVLAFTGTGTLWVDNFELYEDADANPATRPVYSLNPAGRQEILDFQPGSIRIWSTCNNGLWGTSLDSATQIEALQHDSFDPNVGARYHEFSHSLPGALQLCSETGAIPWIIMGHSMNEDEWRGLIEYLAAPYDPLVDTPATKPWAARRYSQGRAAPWTDDFATVRIEFSNEMWNSIFAQFIPDAARAGQLANYFFAQARTSPYFAAVEDKIQWQVNGFISQPNTNGYGQVAWLNAPLAHESNAAPYIGGWENGNQPGGPTITDDGYQAYMVHGPRTIFPQLTGMAASRDLLRAANPGRHYDLSLYEGGPGYGLPSASLPFNATAEAYGKSLAGGVATLDTFLHAARMGYNALCYYVYGHGRNWYSHAYRYYGGQPHPNWLALQLRNHYASGSVVNVIPHSAPTQDFAALGGAPAVTNLPMVTCYAWRDEVLGKITVLTLSRKMSGNTPVTLRLPMSAVTTATLHRLTGDPRATNQTAHNVVEETVPLGAVTPVHTFTLPPGSVYAFEFTGDLEPAPTAPLCHIAPAPGQTDPSAEGVLRFAVEFTEPVTGFTTADVQLGGDTGASEIGIDPAIPFLGGNYIVSVSGMLQGGPVMIAIPAGAVTGQTTGQPNLAGTGDLSITYAPAAVTDSVLASENAGATPGAFLHGLTTGTGWTTAWSVAGHDGNANQFRIRNTTPLTYGNLCVDEAYIQGGYNNQVASRRLDVAGAFPNHTVAASNPAVIGRTGSVLWMSFLLRKDTNDSSEVAVSLVNGDDIAEIPNIRLGIGFYGAGSMVSGQRRWSLFMRNAANTAFETLPTTAPVVIGETALFVVRMQFGASDRIDVFVNPPLGSTIPSPTLTRTTSAGSADTDFRTIGFWTSASHTNASFDELRLGDSWLAVTPQWTPLELWRRQHFGSMANAGPSADSADQDGDGLPNLAEFGLDSNPTLASPGAAPSGGYDTAQGISLHFRRNLAQAAALTYVIESAETLDGPWDNIVASKAGSQPWTMLPGVGVADNGAGPVTVTCPVDIDAQPTGFLRLRITSP